MLTKRKEITSYVCWVISNKKTKAWWGLTVIPSYSLFPFQGDAECERRGMDFDDSWEVIPVKISELEEGLTWKSNIIH